MRKCILGAVFVACLGVALGAAMLVADAASFGECKGDER